MPFELSIVQMMRAPLFAALMVTLIAGATALERATAATISLSAGLSALPNIGKVVQSSPTSTGTFRVDASTGGVSVISGTLTRVSAGSVAVPTYTVICKNGSGAVNACGSGLSTVTVSVHNPVAATAATIAAFNATVAPGIGASSCSAISGQNSTNLSFSCVLNNGNPGNNNTETVATISLGMDISILSVANTGQQNPGYTVTTSP